MQGTPARAVLFPAPSAGSGVWWVCITVFPYCYTYDCQCAVNMHTHLHLLSCSWLQCMLRWCIVACMCVLGGISSIPADTECAELLEHADAVRHMCGPRLTCYNDSYHNVCYYGLMGNMMMMMMNVCYAFCVCPCVGFGYRLSSPLLQAGRLGAWHTMKLCVECLPYMVHGA
jgi:hypothetical protein